MAHLLIVAAAGMGSRLGRSEPKALVPVLERPLICWTLDALAGIPFAGRRVAVPPGRENRFEAAIGGSAGIVAGGETRAASVRRAFESLNAAPADLVCIHDAARPFVTAAETRSVLEAAERTGAAIAATPVVDTLKRVEENRIVTTVGREGLFAAATPQVFRADLLARAFAASEGATDEAALVEGLGVSVAVVPVSRLSFKVTTPEDLAMAEALIRSRTPESRKRKAK
ncbi:MAG TPA: 2-C-methyl-D-erythritol 4-phosphate cytidylyltransferase [Thermoanaerobaculia bacterium]|nr:2-C-methyl-D-erythritol 4-phosphate cytidylyltransferase [Thermoanaerobaculia bacterium]